MSEASATRLEPWRGMAARSGVCVATTLAAWGCGNERPEWTTPLFGVAYLSGAWDLARKVGEDLRQRHFNTEFLMLLVAAGAGLIGAWWEGALLLVLFSSSASMEEYASGRTRREIGALLKGAPKTATRLENGVEQIVAVNDLRPGMQIRVRAGEQVAADFEVLSGESACDESMLTGEAEPVPKRPGETALAGTVNDWGILEGRVLRAAGDSALQRIIRLIHEAQQQRAPTQRFTDRFGTRYTAGVLVACVGLFLVAWLIQDLPVWRMRPGQPSAFYRAMTLLVVLSPCALVLSVPSAILSAIACGARHGVLFRGGTAVELLARINVVALDKTGTLTAGELQFAGLDPLEGNADPMMSAAAGLARLSNHPISRSIYRATTAQGAIPWVFTNSETIPGQGIFAWNDGHRYGLGNRLLLASWLSPKALENLPAAPEEANETWVVGPGLLGRMRLQDRLRPESGRLIAALHAAGLRTLMLTGDREGVAIRMGREAGVLEVKARLSPADKVKTVQELRAAGCRVAMIGDGVNDAPVLAAADVGIAMGARGSDAALEQADVVLMNDRLEQFLFARRLSQRAARIIDENLWVALGAMGLMAMLTLGWAKVPLWLGVATHEGSTAVVVLNSLRLLFPPTERTPEARPFGQ